MRGLGCVRVCNDRVYSCVVTTLGGVAGGAACVKELIAGRCKVFGADESGCVTCCEGGGEVVSVNTRFVCDMPMVVACVCVLGGVGVEGAECILGTAKGGSEGGEGRGSGSVCG